MSTAGLRCIRCWRLYPERTLFEGCPHCRAEGRPSNVTVVYEDGAPVAGKASLKETRSLWRYQPFLPRFDRVVSLGEGMTPLLESERLAARVGMQRLAFKDETRNPTWSYKDRLASLALSRALSEGAPGVAIASSGNHGAATAAYAARAGLPCLIFTMADTPLAVRRLMRSYGAMLVGTEQPAERWSLLAHAVNHLGWYGTGNLANPPAGSPPYGVEGYKTISYEIAESRGWEPPDVVLLPVSYGDGLYGIYKGFAELKAIGWTSRVPRLVAVESAGSLATALAGGLDIVPEVPTRPSSARSIHTPISTYQALHAIRQSEGTAVVVNDEETLHAQRLLSELEGLSVEFSSAAALAGAIKLAQTGWLAENEDTVVVLTSSSMKDPLPSDEADGRMPIIPADAHALRDAIRATYDYDLELSG